MFVELDGNQRMQMENIRDLVRQHSTKYIRLQNFISEHKIKIDVRTEFCLSYACKILTEYEQIDPESVLAKFIARKESVLVYSYNAVADIRRKQEESFAQFDKQYQTRESNMRTAGIPFTLFKTVEGELCKELEDNALAEISIVLKIDCDSEEMHRSKSFRFSFKDLKRVYEAGESLGDKVIHKENPTEMLESKNVGNPGIQPEMTEMSRITPALRYTVLKRDRFCCTLCGAAASDGVKLEVEYIVPLCQGGKAKISNLRTLCDRCNRGINDAFIQEERGKMSQTLRETILRRDGYRCVLCGATERDGIRLHIDHIMPVSKGGKSDLDNLRTLCDRCNFGKHDRYDIDGLN